MSDRIDRLETDHRDLRVKVDGMSRGLERVKRDQVNLFDGLCKEHRKDTNDLEIKVDAMKTSINDVERKQDNKWPSLLASMIGGAMMLVPFVVLLFTLILPALKTLDAIAQTQGVGNG